MDDKVLKGHKLQAYVLLKILKYCTGSSATSYKVKFAVQQALLNKEIESMDELGAGIREIIHYNTIRGKFSSVHPDLAAEGITRVEVGEEGLHFVTKVRAQEKFENKVIIIVVSEGLEQRPLFDKEESEALVEEEKSKRAIAMSLEVQMESDVECWKNGK